MLLELSIVQRGISVCAYSRTLIHSDYKPISGELIRKTQTSIQFLLYIFVFLLYRRGMKGSRMKLLNLN